VDQDALPVAAHDPFEAARGRIALSPGVNANQKIALLGNPPCGRFYRLLRTEERLDRGWTAHAYLLKEAEPNEVLRGLLRYDPPGPVSRAGPGGVK
jgi:hypothetical protein